MQTEVEASNGKAASGPGGVAAGRRRVRQADALIWRALEGMAWAAFFAFAAAFLVLRYWVLPDIGRYRDDIVAVVSRSIGMPVVIREIEADWLGFRPRVTFVDVRVHDRQGREVLVLPSVDNVVSWRSLLALQLRLSSIEIQGPKLALRRDRSGVLHVAGLKLEPRAGGEGEFADWIFRQREITVRDAEIEWIDEQRGAPPLWLRSLQFRLQNAGEAHAFGLTARPPAELGSSLDVRAELQGRSLGQLGAWSGRIYAELGDTDLSGWRAWVDYPIDVLAGSGALRVWATLERGKPQLATADVALSGAAVRLRADLPALALSRVGGRLLGRLTDGGFEVGGRDLGLEVAGGPVLRPTSFRVAWERAGAQGPARGSAAASLIELQPLAQIGAFLPLSENLKARLRELAPAGDLLDATFEWSGPISDVTQFSARSRFEGLAMSARDAVPGFSGLSGSVEVTSAGGALHLRTANAVVDLPRVFPEPRIPLDALSGRIDWVRRGTSEVEVRVSSLAFSNPHATGNAFGSYVYSDAGPGLIDLSLQVTRADGRYTEKYLPRASIMGEGTRAWLARAILAGEVSDARMRMTGDLRDFPYASSFAGQFFVKAHVKGGILDYAEGWPRIEGIEADLLFDRRSMDIVGRRARILGTELSDVRVSIADMLAPKPVLAVRGRAAGPTPQFLGYVASSPLHDMTGRFTDTVAATGEGRLRLSLDLPLAEPTKTKVAGEYQFFDNSIRYHSDLPPLQNATGSVSFSDSGFNVNAAKGRAFGGAVTVDGGMAGDAGLRIVARGDASAVGLRPVLGAPWNEFFSGGTDYVATVRARKGRAEVTVESSLRGMASSLPPPLAKRESEPMPLRVHVQPGAREGESQIAISVANLVAAEVVRTLDARKVVQRVSVALGQQAGKALRMPRQAGLLLYGALPKLNVDPWMEALPRDDAAAKYVEFDLEFGALSGFGRTLNDVSLKGVADAEGWLVNVGSRELSGEIEYSVEGRGKLTGRLAHLRIPEEVPGAKPAERSRRDLPAIDLVAERFSFRDRALGRLEVRAQQSGLDWQIDSVSISSPDATVSAKGLWRALVPDPGGGAAPGARTSLEVNIEAADTGGFLQRFGYPGLVKGGQGKLSGTLAWSGDPVSLDYPSLDGALSLQASNGQFLKVDPGAGKLVSLMNLQMLPKRLTLDFSDVIEKGFQFERLSGSFRFQNGVLRTQDFRMRGSSAEVEMRGEANLVAETQDMRVRVVPSLGAGAATIAGILGGPVVAAGSLLAEKVLRDPLGQIFASEYSVTGTWADPKVERINVPGPEPGLSGPP